MHDSVPFVRFEKIEKHPWRSVTLSKVAGFWPATVLKVTLLHGCFSRLLNCTSGTKLRKHHIVILIPLRIFFSILPWVFFTFLKLYRWWQISQSVSFTLWLSLHNIRRQSKFYPCSKYKTAEKQNVHVENLHEPTEQVFVQIQQKLLNVRATFMDIAVLPYCENKWYLFLSLNY